MRTLSAMKYDIKFQIRHGFYYAYAIVSILYVILLRLVPTGARDYLSVLVLFTDPTVLGFFFIGGIILLEKDQSILASLFVTPMRAREYILSKLLTLSLLSLISSAVIVVFSSSERINPAMLIFAVVPSSTFFTLMGIALAARIRTLNQYIIASTIYLIPFILPIFGFLRLFDLPIYHVLPGYGSLVLLKGVFSPLAPASFLYSIILLLVWNIIAYNWAVIWFDKYIIQRMGGGSI